MLEIEIKAKLNEEGPVSADQVAERLIALGYRREEVREEADLYFNGCGRDFRKTDEALRLRSAKVLPAGRSEAFLTYKGPKLDDCSQTRKEIEVSIGNSSEMRSLLEQLGYPALFHVKKQRRHYRKGSVTACLDQVEGLGSFLELEQLSQSEEHQAQTVENLLTVLDRLEVPRENLTRKSYLELLMMSMMS